MEAGQDLQPTIDDVIDHMKTGVKAGVRKETQRRDPFTILVQTVEDILSHIRGKPLTQVFEKPIICR